MAPNPLNSGRDFTVGFFDDRATQQAIVDISSAATLTIFAGAGVSADQAIPTWSNLVRDMLQQLLPANYQKHSVTDSSGDEVILASALVNAYFQLPMASAVDDLLTHVHGAENALLERNEIIRESIYGLESNPKRFLEKPSLARDLLIMSLTLKACGVNVVILTTNYDCVLEEILDQDPDIKEILAEYELTYSSFAGEAPPRTLGPKVLPIVHIHGKVPRSGECERVIFSEPDYVQWMDNGSLRNYIYARFDHGHTLMTGTSLRDHNIITYLKQTDFDSARRYALLAVKGDPAFNIGRQVGHEVTSAVQQRRAELLGIKLLLPDFYGQVRQFFIEVSVAAALNGGSSAYYASNYMQRVRQWASDFEPSYSDNSVRQAVTEKLQVTAGWISSQIAEAQHVKLELWCRKNVDARTMELWCSSQTLRLDNPSYWPHEVKIELGSLDPAIISFANRSATQARITNRSDGRWTHFLASPVTLQNAPYNDIPVGTIVVLLHAPQVTDGRIPGLQSALHKLSERIATVGVESLTPPIPTH